MIAPGDQPELGQSVLVIGCGFIGGHVARELAARGVSVRGLTRSPSPEVAAVIGEDRLLIGDAATSALGRALDGVGEVVYCVGGLLPADAEAHPQLDAELTLRPLDNVVAAMRGRPGVGLTLLSSGGTVYGNAHRLPVGEKHPPAPLGAYGAVRLAGEQLAASAAEHGVPVRILRCANVYGEGQPADRGQGAVAVMIDRIARSEPIVLYGDGGSVRDYVYVGDVVDVIARLLGRRDGDLVVNVGSGVGTSLRELLSLVETVLGRQARIIERPVRPFDVDRVVLDIARLRRLLTFVPVGVQDGLERVASHQPSIGARHVGVR